jgi:hypothetical protein
VRVPPALRTRRPELLKNFILLACIFFAGCPGSPSPAKTPASAPQSENNPFWDAGSGPSGSLIFHGCAGIYSKKEESIQLALEEAAKKVAVFTLVEGRLLSFTNIGAGVFDYQSKTETSLIYGDPAAYTEALAFDPETDVLETNRTVFVRVRYQPPEPVSIPYRSSSFQNSVKPAWVDAPPVIPGYTVGLGYAGARAKYADTITASWENSVFSIVTGLYGSAKEEITSTRGPGAFDVASSNTQEIRAAGKLRGFYILDTWTNPGDKSVWTLSIAQKSD